MNEDIVLPDDDLSDDLPHIDITHNDPGFSGGSQQETSFITPEGSQASRWIESYRYSFKSKYGIDDNTFDTLRLNLNRRGNKIYFKNLSLSFDDGRKLYSLNSLKSTGAAEFKNIIRGEQGRVQARSIEGARRSKQPTVQEQPIEPTVVDGKSMTFDIPAFDDGDDDELSQRLTDLRTINAEFRSCRRISSR